MSNLEDWEPFLPQDKLTKTERRIVERTGTLIAQKIMPDDISVLIDAASGRVPRNTEESQLVNYIQGVFDMAAAKTVTFPKGKNLLVGLSMEFALSALKSKAIKSKADSFNYTGPRLRQPGQDWCRV